MSGILKIGTRKSPLALRQVDLVVAAIKTGNPDFQREGRIEIVPMVTSGDIMAEERLADIGGKELFTKEIDEALLSGRVDIAVHSAKDMQTDLPRGLCFAAALPREDARDVLVSQDKYTLTSLPEGAVVGTSSLRRALMLQQKRPDLKIQPIRGNLATRMRKVEEGQFHATILALAGLKRLAIDPLPGTILEIVDMLPAPAQGIIAVQCRENDVPTQALLQRLSHAPSKLAADIERKILQELDGSCKTPIAAYLEHTREGIRIRAILGDERTMRAHYAETQGRVDEVDMLTQDVIRQLTSNPTRK